MSRARILSFTVERFKSFEKATRIEFAPLTVIAGRNNSGKSSLIQSLLLMKQTIQDPRPEVMIALQGIVQAFNLRDLTFGWPPQAAENAGPTITIEWEASVDVRLAKERTLHPNMEEMVRNAKVQWLPTAHDSERLRTKIEISMSDRDGIAQVTGVRLWSARVEIDQAQTAFVDEPLLVIRAASDGWQAFWQNERTDKLTVEMHHFIPLLLIDRRNLGPRHRQRAWHNAYLFLLAQPLEDLSSILSELHYLGSSREPPRPMYPLPTSAPTDIGVSGEHTAPLLHRRKSDYVHFLPPLGGFDFKNLQAPDTVRAARFVDAVNEVMVSLGIEATFRTELVQNLGFQLMCGKATIDHVGRGLNSLLPLVGLGLFADPLRFHDPKEDMNLAEYLNQCKSVSHIALEEPEAHLHPKVASRLAHWLVSLAMSNRQIIVETHSDHLVRRLRRLAVSAKPNSVLERWLLSNVAIVSVEQHDGRTTAETSRLTADGGVEEKWPADFIDEATDEESAIYYQKLEKISTVSEGPPSGFELNSGPEPE